MRPVAPRPMLISLSFLRFWPGGSAPGPARESDRAGRGPPGVCAAGAARLTRLAGRHAGDPCPSQRDTCFQEGVGVTNKASGAPGERVRAPGAGRLTRPRENCAGDHAAVGAGSFIAGGVSRQGAPRRGRILPLAVPLQRRFPGGHAAKLTRSSSQGAGVDP
jgi:hypothetical protein